jgi:hypothetical protein
MLQLVPEVLGEWSSGEQWGAEWKKDATDYFLGSIQHHRTTLRYLAVACRHWVLRDDQ